MDRPRDKARWRGDCRALLRSAPSIKSTQKQIPRADARDDMSKTKILGVPDVVDGMDLPQGTIGGIAVAVARWGFAGPFGAAGLRGEEREANDREPDRRDDFLFLVDLRIHDEVEEVLPRRSE